MACRFAEVPAREIVLGTLVAPAIHSGLDACIAGCEVLAVGAIGVLEDAIRGMRCGVAGQGIVP